VAAAHGGVSGKIGIRRIMAAASKRDAISAAYIRKRRYKAAAARKRGVRKIAAAAASAAAWRSAAWLIGGVAAAWRVAPRHRAA
jgi:hypothetical protein